MTSVMTVPPQQMKQAMPFEDKSQKVGVLDSEIKSTKSTTSNGTKKQVSSKAEQDAALNYRGVRQVRERDRERTGVDSDC